MATMQNVGQTTPLSIRYLDENGQPMPTDPTPDFPPVWSQTNTAVDLLTPAADGLTASAKGVVAGSDTIKMDVSVGGKSFSATLDMTVNAVAPVPTSVEIVAGTPV